MYEHVGIQRHQSTGQHGAIGSWWWVGHGYVRMRTSLTEDDKSWVALRGKRVHTITINTSGDTAHHQDYAGCIFCKLPRHHP